VQDFELELSTPMGSRVKDGTVAIRVFHRQYLTNSALCHGFVFSNPSMPRVSEVSGSGSSGTNTISIGMTASAHISVELVNAPSDIAVREYSVMVGQSEVNIKSAAYDSQTNKALISFASIQMDSEQVVDTLVVFGAVVGACSSTCCKDGSCATVCSNLKTACFALRFYDDTKPSLVVRPNLRGPAFGGEPINLKIYNFPVPLRELDISILSGRFSVFFGASDVVGEVVIESSTREEIQLMIIPPAWDLNEGIGRSKVAARIEHSARPDHVLSFQYVYEVVKPEIVDVGPVSGFDTEETEVFLTVDSFPYPTDLAITFGDIQLTPMAITVWPASTIGTSFISLRCPSLLPVGYYTVRLTPKCCSSPCNKQVSFIFEKIDSSIPRIASAVPIVGAMCKEYLPSIIVDNIPVNEDITAVMAEFYDNMDQYIETVVVETVVSGDTTSLLIPQPQDIMDGWYWTGFFGINITWQNKDNQVIADLPDLEYFAYDCFAQRIVDVTPTRIPSTATTCGRSLPLTSKVSIVVANFPLDGEMFVFVGTQARAVEVASIQELVACTDDENDCRRSQIVLQMSASDLPGTQEVALYSSTSNSPLYFSIEYVMPCDLDSFCEGSSMIPNRRMLQEVPSIECEVKFCIDPWMISDPRIIALTPTKGSVAGGTTVVVKIENMPAFSAADLILEVGSVASKVSAQISMFWQEPWSNLVGSAGLMHIRTPAVPADTEMLTFVVKTRVCSIEKSASFSFEYSPIITGPAIVSSVYPTTLCQSQDLDLFVELENVPKLFQPYNPSLIRAKVQNRDDQAVSSVVASDRSRTFVVIRASGPWQLGTLDVLVFSAEAGIAGAVTIRISVSSPPVASVQSIYPLVGRSDESNVMRIKVAYFPVDLEASAAVASLFMDSSDTMYTLPVLGSRNLSPASCTGQCCSLIEIELESPPLNSEDRFGGEGVITVDWMLNLSVSFKFSFRAADFPSLELVHPRKQTICQQGKQPIKFYLRNFPSLTESRSLRVLFGSRPGEIKSIQDLNGLLLVEAISPVTGLAGLLTGEISATTSNGQAKSASFEILFEAPMSHVEPFDGPVTGGSLITLTVYGWGEAAAAVSVTEDLFVIFNGIYGNVVSLLDTEWLEDSSYVRVLIRTPRVENPGSFPCTIGTIDSSAVSHFNFEYFDQPEIVSISSQKATLHGKTEALDGQSVEIILQNFPEISSPADLQISFGTALCDGYRCSILGMAMSTDGVHLSLSVPKSDVPGNVMLTVEYIGSRAIPDYACVGNPDSAYTISKRKAFVAFNFYVPLPVILTTKLCSSCYGGRTCLRMGRCGDRSMPLVNKAPLTSSGGTLSVLVKDLCFVSYDATDGRVSPEDSSRLSLALGIRFAEFKRVAFMEDDLTILEFSIPEVDVATSVTAKLLVHPRSRSLPCSATITFVRFDERLQMTCENCKTCSDGSTFHNIAISNLVLDPELSAVDQISVRFGSVDATGMSIQSAAESSNVSVEVMAPPYSCPTCSFTNGMGIVPLTLTLKLDTNIMISTDFTYWSPPRIVFATMCPSGTIIYVTFDQSTDRAHMSAADDDCALILDQATIPQFGQSPKCKWSSDTSLDIYLDSGASAVPGNTITVRSGVLRGVNSLCKTLTSHASIMPPRILQRPAVTLSGVGSIDPCSEMTITAMYASPRPLVFEWGCLNDNALDQAVRAWTGATLHLGPGTPEMGVLDKVYEITARATDFLGAMSAQIVFEVLKKSSSGPQLLFDPPSLTVYRDEEVLVSVRASFSECPVVRERMVFSWRQVSGPEINAQYFKTGSQFALPGGVLDTCQQYSIVAQVSMGSDPSKASESIYIINVLPRPLVAQIQGADMLRASAASSFTLNADSSRDPDMELTTDQGLVFEWSCTISDGGISSQCVDSGGSVVKLYNTPSITISAGTLSATFDVPYLFSVRISKSSSSPCYKAMSKSTMPVFLAEEEIPLVYIAFESGFMHGNGYLQINVNSPMVMQGQCDTKSPPYTLAWEFSPSVSLKHFELLGDDNQTLFLAPGQGVFVPGNMYKAKLSCADDSGAESYTEMTIMINTPPTGPRCVACLIGEEGCLKIGIPVFDKFRYCCNNWADPTLNPKPLEYQFGYSFDDERQ